MGFAGGFVALPIMISVRINWYNNDYKVIIRTYDILLDLHVDYPSPPSLLYL